MLRGLARVGEGSLVALREALDEAAVADGGEGDEGHDGEHHERELG